MMTRKLLLSSTVALTMSGAALAADLPRRAAPPPMLPPVPVFTWTGAYFGINAGYISSDRNTVNTVGVFNQPGIVNNGVIIGNRPGALNLNTDGFTGGGQIGYNYQFGAFVLGVEADAAYTDMNRTVGFLGNAGGFSAFNQRLDYLGTVRGRVGVAFDRVLVYGTGGFAYGDTTYRGVFTSPGFGVTFAGGSSRMETGWVAGGGIEYALPTDSFLNFFRSSAVTLKAEGLYYDLGKRTVLLNGTLTPYNGAYASRFQNNGFIARVGLNYKFGTF